MSKDLVLDLFQYVLTGVGVLGAVVSLIGAFRSGLLRLSTVLSLFRRGASAVEATAREKELTRTFIKVVMEPSRERESYEQDQLAQYYAQVMSQAKTSYWFGQFWAAVGVVVIFLAVFTHSNAFTESSAAVGATLVESVAGIVMTTVGYLFFKQSGKKDKMWSAFLENLRIDRQQLEGRKMCDELQDPYRKDYIKGVLSLVFAGVKVESDVIVRTFQSFGQAAPPHPQAGQAVAPAATPHRAQEPSVSP